MTVRNSAEWLDGECLCLLSGRCNDLLSVPGCAPGSGLSLSVLTDQALSVGAEPGGPAAMAKLLWAWVLHSGEEKGNCCSELASLLRQLTIGSSEVGEYFHPHFGQVGLEGREDDKRIIIWHAYYLLNRLNPYPHFDHPRPFRPQPYLS